MIIKISGGVILSVYGMIGPYLQSWRKVRPEHPVGGLGACAERSAP